MVYRLEILVTLIVTEQRKQSYLLSLNQLLFLGLEVVLQCKGATKLLACHTLQYYYIVVVKLPVLYYTSCDLQRIAKKSSLAMAQIAYQHDLPINVDTSGQNWVFMIVFAFAMKSYTKASKVNFFAFLDNFGQILKTRCYFIKINLSNSIVTIFFKISFVICLLCNQMVGLVKAKKAAMSFAICLNSRACPNSDNCFQMSLETASISFSCQNLGRHKSLI